MLLICCLNHSERRTSVRGLCTELSESFQPPDRDSERRKEAARSCVYVCVYVYICVYALERPQPSPLSMQKNIENTHVQLKPWESIRSALNGKEKRAAEWQPCGIEYQEAWMYSACAGDPIVEQDRTFTGTHDSKMKSAEVEDRALFTETYCKICNAQLISESQRVAHYESKKHANKVRLFYMLHPEDGGPPSKKLRPDDPESDETEVDKNKCCTLCNMFFTSAIVAESHYQGKTHAKRVKLVLGESADIPARAEPVQETQEPTEVTIQEEDTLWSINIGSESRKFCDLCRAWFNNPMMAQQHYEGKKHKKNAARAKLLQRLGETLDSEALEALRTSYSCNTCNMVLNSVEQYNAHLKGARHQNNANNIPDGTKLNGQKDLQNPVERQIQPRINFHTRNNLEKRMAKEGKDNDSGRSSLSPPQVTEDTGECSPENNFFSIMVTEETHILC